MEIIAKYLGSGSIYKYPNNSAISLNIVKLSDIINIIIPFFNKNSCCATPLGGVAQQLFDYLDWCEIAKLMVDGNHLTLEGLDLIRSIKSGMNSPPGLVEKFIIINCMINLIAMHIQRFFAYLSAFTAGMLVLICGGNFLVMFVGWESIGVASYLLINFYFTRIQANKAAILAFTMNRGGDMLMSIGFFAIFSIFGSLSYSEIFSLVPFINETTITIISLFLLGGALAKSANIPLHSWLPGSMEAPTPVSALLHAATLVTAGIYLLIRVSPILEYSSTALLVITIIGSTTAFIAATSGLLANDLKRIIAFSTISQLGYYLLLILLVSFFLLCYNFPTHSSLVEIDLYIPIYNKIIQSPLLCSLSSFFFILWLLPTELLRNSNTTLPLLAKAREQTRRHRRILIIKKRTPAAPGFFGEAIPLFHSIFI
jgi:hypothetical protein